MKKFLLGILVAASQFATAQIVDVVSMRQLPADMGTFYFPTVSPQGDYLLVSDTGYKGLVKIDLATNKKVVLSTASSAGYYPSISSDGKKIAFREDSYQNNLRYVSVKSLDLSSSKVVAKEEMKPCRNFSGMQMANGLLKIAQGKKETLKKMERAAGRMSEPPMLVIEDMLMVIYKNGIRTEIVPNGKDKTYIWASISPDGKKIVYTVTTPPVCTYVCDMDGKNPVALGQLNAPQWLGNNCVIGMNDKDDGHVVTSSSVEVVSIDGKVRRRLTPDSMKAMYPSASADGKVVAFHTLAGEIYVMNINFK